MVIILGSKQPRSFPPGVETCLFIVSKARFVTLRQDAGLVESMWHVVDALCKACIGRRSFCP